MTPEQLEAFREASKEAVAKLQECEQRMLEEDLPDAAKVFAHLADPDNLRQSGLIVTAVCKDAEVPFRKTIDQVERVLGESLADLLRDLLLDIGFKLRTEYRVFQVMEIPQALGISYSTFRTHWKARLGSSPKNLPAPPVAGAEPASKDAWERLFSGELTGDEEGAVRELIRSRYPEMLQPVQILELWLEPELVTRVDDGAGASVLLIDGENAARRFAAERVWPVLDGQPRDVQKAVLSRFAFASSALFDFLHQKAREEGRSDRERGIDLAELAVLSLEFSRKHLGRRYPELLVIGWAWVANANALAFRFSAAETAFERCERIMEETPRVEYSQEGATFYALKGRLRMYQSKHAEAAELLERGLNIAETLSDERLRARILMTIGANYGYAGFPAQAIPVFGRAITLLRYADDVEARLLATIDLTNALCRCGQYEEAKESLGQSEGLVAQSEASFLVKWVEANVESGLRNRQAAEVSYLEAREGFAAMNDPISCACIDLDYSILLAEHDDPQALEISARVYPIMERYHLLPQTARCLNLFRRAIQRNRAEKNVLRKLLNTLWRDPLLRLGVSKESGSDT